MVSGKIYIGFLAGMLILFIGVQSVALSREAKRYANVGFFQFEAFEELDEDTLEKAPVRLAITWSLFEKKQGVFDFENKQADQIDQYLEKGYTVIPSIRAKSKWAVVNPTDSRETSESDDVAAGTDDLCGSAPLDMDHEKPLRKDESYSPTYYRFVRTIAEHYRGKFPIVVLENEINDPIPEGGDWCGTVDEYIRLVLTAKKAFGDVDPSVQIADGALQPRPLMWLVIDEYLRQGRADDAIRLYQQIEQEQLTRDELEQMRDQAFTEPRVARAKEFIDAGLHQWVDIGNFHYLHHPDGLDDIVSYLKRHSPQGKRFMSTGYGRSNRFLSGKDDAAAKDIVKGAAHMLALGISPVILTTRPGSDRVATALIDMDGELKQLNARAFETTARFLGNVDMPVFDFSDDDMHEYTFRSPIGYVTVLWPKNEKVYVVNPGRGCRLYDYLGSELGTETYVTSNESPFFAVCR